MGTKRSCRGRTRAGTIRLASGLFSLIGLALAPVTGAAGVLELAGASGAAGAATHGTPRLVVAPSPASPGQTLTIAASTFPHSTNFQIQVCGNDDLGGSTDCVVAGGGTEVTSDQGSFRGAFTLATPPVTCPCVVAAVEVRTGTTFTAPISIVGVASGPTHANGPVFRLSVVEASLSGGGSPGEWFGGGAHRTLVVQFRNTGTVPIANPTLLLRVGTTPVPVGRIAEVAVGAERTVRVPVTFPPLTVGSAAVVGQLGPGDGQFVPFTVSTTVVPWGLLVVGLVVVQLILLGVRNALRRRIRYRPTGSGAGRRRSREPLVSPVERVGGEVPSGSGAVAAEGGTDADADLVAELGSGHRVADAPSARGPTTE